MAPTSDTILMTSRSTPGTLRCTFRMRCAPGEDASSTCGKLAAPVVAVVRVVRRLRSHPLVPSSIPIYGYIYDVKTGKLNEVAEATRIGRPS